MSSKKPSTSFISLCLFQFFFLFLLTRFLRLLTKVAGSADDFRCRKPGCEATTRFKRLAAMLRELRRCFFFSCLNELHQRRLQVRLRKCSMAMELLWKYKTRFKNILIYFYISLLGSNICLFFQSYNHYIISRSYYITKRNSCQSYGDSDIPFVAMELC